MIGVYDSGVGGMLLARMLGQRWPGITVTCYMDMTGGLLDAEPTERLAERWHDGYRYLAEQGARLILVACHKTGSLSMPILRHNNDIPVADIPTATAQAVTVTTANSSIGLISDRTVIASGVYQRLLNSLLPNNQLFCQPCPLLTPMIEEGWYRQVETKMIIKRYLRPLKQRQIETLIPACSHYQIVLPLIAARVGRRIRVIDPFAALVTVAATYAESQHLALLKEPACYRLHCTRQTPQVDHAISTVFGRYSGCWEIL